MALHNTSFSVASLAKTMMADVDQTKPETLVPTQTLVLLLATIMELTMPTPPVQDTASKAVTGLMARFQEAEKTRDG